MFKNLKGITALFFVAVFAVSCNKYNQLLKSNDVELKYKAAKEYYAKAQAHYAKKEYGKAAKEYGKATPLFDDLLISLKGDSRFEEVYFYYAYCRYGLGETVIASYYFYNFYESFPLSPKAEEALYMHVYCDYLESYPYYLDPSVTIDAMNSVQLFINVYPQSSRVAECNKYLDELRGRLRKKSLESAYLYLKIEDYKAAAIAFQNTLKDYPELENKNEIEFLVVKCKYLLAINSVEYKQEERFRDVISAYREYADNHGSDDKYHAEALEYFNKAQKNIREIPLRMASDLLATKQYDAAVRAYSTYLLNPNPENKERAHYGLIRSYYKSAINGDEYNKAANLQSVISESDAYIAAFGVDAKNLKKVQKLRKRADRKLKKLTNNN